MTIDSDNLGTLTFAGLTVDVQLHQLEIHLLLVKIWDQLMILVLQPTGVGSGEGTKYVYIHNSSLMDGLTMFCIIIFHQVEQLVQKVATGFSYLYTGVEGLTVSYATSGNSAAASIERCY